MSFHTFSALHHIRDLFVVLISIMASAALLCVRSTSDCLELARVGKSWQELALLIHCQDLALGSRVAPPLDAGWHGAKFACLQKVSPPFQGAVLGVATPPFRSAGGRVWGAGGRLGGGEVHQTAGGGALRRKAAVVQHGGGAASGGIGGLGAAWLVAAEEVMVGLAGHRWPGRAGQAWNSAPPACQPVVGNHGLIPVKLSSTPLPSSTNQFQGKLSPFRLLPIKQNFLANRKHLRRSKN